MKELRKIILINSIQTYAEIELDASLHFLGDPGSGKTDYLHLISSFYTGSLIHPQNSEKGFSYFLPHSNSWIIFEIAGAKGLFSLAFHREENIPKAYFLNGDYEKESFFKKEKALHWKDVKANLKKQKLHQAGPFDIGEGYWQVLNGSYSGKDKSDLRRYAIADSVYAHFLPKLYKHIWQNGEIPFELLKEMLCAFEETEDAKLELEEIDKASKSLRTDLRSIRAWRAAVPDIEEVLKQEKSLKRLEETDQKLKAQLAQSLKLHQEKKQSLKAAFEASKLSLEELESQASSKKSGRLDVLQELYEKKGALGYKLSMAKEKAAFHEAGNIQQKLQQFYELNLRKQRAELFRELKQDSKKELEQTQAWWEASLKKEKQLAKLSENALKEKEDLLVQWTSARKDLEAEKNSVKVLEDEIEKLKKEQRAVEAEKLQVEGKSPSIQIEKYVRQIQRAREESIELKLQIRLNEEQSISLQKRREKEFEALEVDRKESEEKALDLLKQKREAHKILESQIANSGRAFMGWLEKNYPDWQESVGKLLKDEVLLSPFLSPGIERINELFYGIHLELSELPESSLSLEQLQKDKEQLEKEIGQLEKGLAELQQKHLKQMDTREKYYRQKSRESKRKLQKDTYELQQLELAIKKSEAEIDKGSLRIDQQKEAALIKLSYREADISEGIKEAEKAYQQALQKWEEQKSALEKSEKKALEKWEAKQAKEREVILAAWQEFESKKAKDLDENLLGPDIFIWEKLQKEIQAYELDKIQFIDQLPIWEMEMAQLEIKISNRAAIEQLSEAEVRRKGELLKEEWESANNAWQQWQDQEKEALHWMKNELPKGVASEEIEPLEKLLPELEKIEDEKNVQSFELRAKLRQALSYFSVENTFGLGVFDSDKAEKDQQQLKQLRLLFEGGKIEELLEGMQQRQSELLATVNELFSQLQPDLKRLKSRLANLSEGLQNQFEGQLERGSQFAIRYTSKGIFKSLSKLRTFYLENRDQLGGSSLFNQGDKAELNKQAFEILEEMDGHLQALPDKLLSPYQMLELEWKVGEAKSLQDFGPLSPKSKRAIHSYLSIYLLKEILANEKELSTHFFMDDILELGPSFLQYVKEQLQETRLKLCSASVHTNEHISAERFLQLSISREGKALISPAQA